jgi:photosynthetic reaction center cytochrome c subunit
MRMRIFVTLLLVLLPLGAQDPPKPDAPKEPAKQEKRVIPPPTNLKVLKVTTGAEVGQIMRTFTAGLGVQCIYCHIQGNFASDENPKKATARTMITMMQKINTGFGDGKMHVSCYTCHRGEAEPKTAPEPRGGG